MSKTIWKKAIATSLALLMVSGAVPLKPVTDLVGSMAVTAYAAEGEHFSVNDAGTEYTIHDADGWNVFCECLKDSSYNRFSGKTVKLGADITVSTMAGGDSQDFCGTFDGDRHTLTFNYGDSDHYASEEYIAPFRYVSNTKPTGSSEDSPAAIKNLHVKGEIYTSKKCAAGLVARHWGKLNIVNCRSSIVIHSSVSGDGTHGGFHAVPNDSLTIKGCLFDGKLLTTSGTINCGGFVGWRGAGTLTITDSVYSPADIEDGEQEVGVGTDQYRSCTFARNGSAGTNCYYTRTLGTAQGKAPHTIAAGDNVTLSLAGTATEYSVSGITAYEGSNGLKVGNTIYAGNEDSVQLTLGGTAPVGYEVTGYEVNAGTLAGTENPYTLTMPDANVTVSAANIGISASYTISTNAAHGTIITTVDGSSVNSANADDIVTLSFNADTGYEVKSYTVTDESGNGIQVTDNQFRMPEGNVTVTATVDVPSTFDSTTGTLTLKGTLLKGPKSASPLVLPEGVTTSDVKKIVVDPAGTTFPVNSIYLFYKFNSVETIDLTGADTSQVENMRAMFYDLDKLTFLDLRSFDTRNVKNMSNMFYSCGALKSLDLSGFNTSSVTEMTKLFYRSNNLTTIYVGTDWSTDAVTDSTDMFYVCSRLKGGAGTEYNSSFTDKTYARIDGGTENPGYFTAYTYTLVPAKEATETETGNIAYYIGSDGTCYLLTNGRYVRTTLEAVTIPMLESTAVDINIIADHCSVTATVDGSPVNAAHYNDTVTLSFAPDAGYEVKSYTVTKEDGTAVPVTDNSFTMPDSVVTVSTTVEKINYTITKSVTHGTIITTVDGSPVNTAHYSDTVTLSFVPDAGYEVKSYTVTKEDGTAVPVTDNSFTMPDSVVTVSATVEKIHYTITKSAPHCTVTATVDGSSVNTAHYNDTVKLSFAPDAGYEVKSYTVTKKDGTAVPVTDNSFTMPDSAVTVSVTVDVPSTFDSTTGTLTLKGTILKGSNYDSTMILPAGVNKTDVKKIVVDPAGATFPADASYLFFRFSNVTDINLQGADSGSVTNMANMFYGCKSLTSLDLTGFDTHAVTDFWAMFGYCEQLVSLDLSGFDTGAAEIMGSMFMDCSELVSLDLSSFTTGKVTDMNCMFYDCCKLTSLNLSGFDTGKVTLMTQMFESCKKLTTVYVGDGWSTDAVTDSLVMFNNCFSLKGGAGTKYDDRFTDKNYARIDGGTENPGYFTAFYTLVPAVEPTYTTEGNSAYYIGADGKYYVLTDGGYVEIEENAWVIPMLEKTEVVINSVDINGIKTPATVYAEIYTDADYTLPKAPYLDGYTFRGWKVNGTLYTAAEAAQSAVAAAVAEKPASVTVAVDYEKLPATYTVTVVNGTLKNGEASGSYQPSVQLYAVASATNADGQKFSCWKVGEKIVGYETTYAFRMPSADMTLTAEYVAAETAIEKVGTGYIESVKRPAANKLSFVSILSVPDGCQMLKAGVVVQSTETLGGAELTKTNAKLIKFSDTSKNHYSSFKYTWTMSTSNHTKQWTVRPYLEYTDANGDTQVIYGDAVSKCVNDVSM